MDARPSASDLHGRLTPEALEALKRYAAAFDEVSAEVGQHYPARAFVGFLEHELRASEALMARRSPPSRGVERR